MTEAEWLAGRDPQPMIESLRGELSERKLRLFACACCYRVGWLLLDDRSWDALAVGERHAEGRATDEELMGASGTAAGVFQELRINPEGLAAGAVSLATGAAHEGLVAMFPAEWAIVSGGPLVARLAVGAAHQAADASLDRGEECAAQADLLRDIFGNPFRPVAFDPNWRTSDVLALARGIHNQRAFDRMPILADALQDAGCDNPAILDHCRGDGAHARGCWVVDLVLEKQ